MADRRLAWALAAVIVRYLTTIQPHAHRELARWRQRAHAIPDPALRAHVLRPFDADMSAQGAALFAVLAPLRMQRQLVPLLVAYVLLWSYVDVRTERDPHADPHLLDALLDALEVPLSTRMLPGDRYLADLVHTCQRGCATLPSWHIVQPLALRHAHDGRNVQAINHGPRRLAEQRLRAWAAPQPRWHEQSAAASSPLPIHALMALATDPLATTHDAMATATAYQPISALGVLCDHFIDQAEDDDLANHSYLSYYDTPAERARGLGDLAEAARCGVRRLHANERHTVILAAMAGMFLSDPKAWAAESTATSRAVLDRIGAPVGLLLVLLRARRRLAT
jgi:tetraprenyl-beta-curcumene synthase